MATPMGLTTPVPGVGGTSGPLWAQMVNTSIRTIELHDHTSGKGNQVPAAAININGDLPFNSNNINNPRSVRLTNYASTGVFAATLSDKSCIFASGGELFYRDQSGINVQITNSGSVAGSVGNIGGLKAPAAVTWSSLAGNLVFSADTGTNLGMNLLAASLVLGSGDGGLTRNKITITVPNSVPTPYTVTLPAAAPAAGQVMASDGSGNLGWFYGLLPLGSVIATFPNLTGAYSTSATTVADASGFVKCAGQTISDSTSPMNGAVVPNINNSVFLMGATAADVSGGSNSLNLAHTHSLNVSGTAAVTGGLPDHIHSLDNTGGAAIHATATFNGTDYIFQVLAAYNGPGQAVTTTAASRIFVNPGGAGSPPVLDNLATNGGIGSVALTGVTGSITALHNINSSGSCTASGTSGSSLSSSTDIRPAYISTVYLMRIK